MVTLLALVIISCSDKKQEVPQNIVPIVVDWDNISDEFDYSPWVEDSALVIPLETTDECLIGQVDKLVYQNHKIYIADNLSKAIYIFDETGHLLSKLKAVGNGPQEYLDITAFTVHDGRLLFFDKLKRVVFAYNEKGHFLYKKDVSDLWAYDIFCIGDNLYLMNGDSDSGMGRYHLFKTNVENGKEDVKAFLPFEDNGKCGWGIDRYCSASHNEAVFTVWPYDVLYIVKDNETYPAYKVDFGDKHLPKQYIEADGETALTVAIKNRYVTGIQGVTHMDRYILFSCNDGKNVIVIYDKQTGEVVVTRHFYNDKLGGLTVSLPRLYVQDGYLIQHRNPDVWTMTVELGNPLNYEDSKYRFYSAHLRKMFNKLQYMDTESNPVVIIQKLKEGV